MKQRFGFSRRAKLAAVVLSATLWLALVGVALAKNNHYRWNYYRLAGGAKLCYWNEWLCSSWTRP